MEALHLDVSSIFTQFMHLHIFCMIFVFCIILQQSYSSFLPWARLLWVIYKCNRESRETKVFVKYLLSKMLEVHSERSNSVFSDVIHCIAASLQTAAIWTTQNAMTSNWLPANAPTFLIFLGRLSIQHRHERLGIQIIAFKSY